MSYNGVGSIPESESLAATLRIVFSGEPEPLEKKDNDLVQRAKSVVMDFLKIMDSLFNSHKGIYALAKFGRSMESLMIELNKYVLETQQGLDTNPSFNTGLMEALKTLRIANGILAGVNLIVSIPEMILHGKKIVEVGKAIREGDWAELTLSFGLDEGSFWTKQIANAVELIRFLESHRFYDLGAVSNGLTIVKSFADGISSTLSIWLNFIKIHYALKGEEAARQSAEKWAARKANIVAWSEKGLPSHAQKMVLKTHLLFLDDAIKLAKAEKAKEDAIKALEVQKEAVGQALLLRKVIKVIDKAGALHYGSLTPEQSKALEAGFAIIRDKIWHAKLKPSSRKVILDILDNNALTLLQKRDALANLRFPLLGKDKAYGLYTDNLDANTFDLFNNPVSSAAAKYRERLTMAATAEAQWKSLEKHPDQVQQSSKADKNGALVNLKTYVEQKVDHCKEVKSDQKKIVRRAVVSIAFSVGIVALVTLSLVLAFAAPGSLPKFFVTWRPFIFAGLGIAVGILGLVKFGADEVFKVKPRTKPLMNLAFQPIYV